MALTPSAERNVEARKRARRNIITSFILIEGFLLWVFYMLVSELINKVSLG